MNLQKNKNSFYEDAVSKIDPNFFEEPIPESDLFDNGNDNYKIDLIETSDIPEKLKNVNNKINDNINNNKNKDKKYTIIQNEGIDGKKGCCTNDSNCFIF